ncbi:MAG: hypothetical protein KC550_01280 [Nanoarchaeota archaeon]|nr:hypothetical protein [Nanoarchaeota archaeon]
MESKKIESSRSKKEDHLIIYVNKIANEILEEWGDKTVNFGFTRSGYILIFTFYRKKGFLNLGKDVLFKFRFRLSITDSILTSINIEYYDSSVYLKFRETVMDKLHKYKKGLNNVKINEEKHF